MTKWLDEAAKPRPARKRGALVEQSPPLSLDDLRTIYRKRIRETAIVDSTARRGAEIKLLDRMLATIFWLIEKRPLPTERTLTGEEWDDGKK